MLGGELERGPDEVVALRVVLLELLARGDRVVVPVVDPVAIEVGLADLGPVFGRVRGGVGVLPEPLADGLPIGLASRLAPGGVDPAEAASIVWQNSCTPMLSSS